MNKKNGEGSGHKITQACRKSNQKWHCKFSTEGKNIK